MKLIGRLHAFTVWAKGRPSVPWYNTNGPSLFSRECLKTREPRVSVLHPLAYSEAFFLLTGTRCGARRRVSFVERSSTARHPTRELYSSIGFSGSVSFAGILLAVEGCRGKIVSLTYEADASCQAAKLARTLRQSSPEVDPVHGGTRGCAHFSSSAHLKHAVDVHQRHAASAY